MDDVKDKVKGFMKKVNSPFSSSSDKFKGQGRVLGSSSSSSTSAASSHHPLLSRVSPAVAHPAKPNPPVPPSNGEFSPFEPLISSSAKKSTNGGLANSYECPVCAVPYASEQEVSVHVETCLVENGRPEPDPCRSERTEDLGVCIGAFLSADPPGGSVEIFLKLLRNVVREPENVKFRRVRMSNPKIKVAVADAKGGVELMECLGFRLGEEDGEVWATMEVPSEEQISLIKEAVLLLEKQPKERDSEVSTSASGDDAQSVVEQKKIDRQVRVFFLIPESVPEKIELPDYFYKLSVEEIKREVDLRKKKLAESQLLIPKSYREKQMKAAHRKHRLSIIRIQFPDGVALQGVFLPWEPTTALYEFVKSALKDPHLNFELLQPAPHKRRVIPNLPTSGGKPPTLEEEDLVPSALVKFKPIETESSFFTGLSNELLEVLEPLTAAASAINPREI